jgi:hypothetical protein
MPAEAGTTGPQASIREGTAVVPETFYKFPIASQLI